MTKIVTISKEMGDWSLKKEKIRSIDSVPHIHEREIWNARLGLNVGFEEDGKGENFLRPVLVYKVFGNKTFWGIPLTTTRKSLDMYFYLGEVAEKESTAILSQFRLLDNRRLFNKIDVLSKEKFEELNKKFKELLP